MAAEVSASGTTAQLTSTQQQQQNPLSRKLAKILETNLDNDKDTLEALEVLSGFLDTNTLQARRNLRSDLEKRSLALNESFLQCVGQLVEHVKGLQEEVVAMKECCDDMQRRLSDAKSSTAGLLRETAELKQRSKQLDMRSRVVDAFLCRFELTPQEVEALNSGQKQGINEEFFKAMDRVKHIHEDCKMLLRTSQQRAGLEIMETMAMYLESAYEQLYHWIQSRCRTMNAELPEISKNLCRALEELKQRPILFQYCIDEYNIARRMSLVRLFIDALTREGSSGRPIELHSHDPVRYCGDMLGWLHQAIATENDHVSTLLMDSNSEKAVPMLGVVTEGSCRPLHVRVEQVVVSSSDSVVAYQLVNLLRYYSSVFQGLLGQTAPLVQTVNDLLDLQTKMFFSTLNVQSSKILETFETPLSDLVPAPEVSKMLALLQRILASRDMNALVSDNQEQDLRRILSTCLDPLVQYCNESVQKFSRLDKAVYMANCLHLIQSTVSLYEFTESQLEILEAQIQTHLNTIVSGQFGHLMEVAGLVNFHGTIIHSQPSAEDFASLENVSEKLNNLISAPDHHQLMQCRLLTSSRLRDETYRSAVEQFSNAFQSVYNAVSSEKGLVTASNFFHYTPEQVKQLLL